MMTEKVQSFLIFVQVGVLPVFALILLTSWMLRRYAEAVAGALLVKVPRPRVKRWETALFLVAWFMLFVNGATAVYILAHSRTIPGQELAKALSWFVAMAIVVIGSYSGSLASANLEFRQHGVVCGATYSPWESIREWSWSDDGATLHLKLTNSAMSYRLAPGSKGAVQAILEKYAEN